MAICSSATPSAAADRGLVGGPGDHRVEDLETGVEMSAQRRARPWPCAKGRDGAAAMTAELVEDGNRLERARVDQDAERGKQAREDGVIAGGLAGRGEDVDVREDIAVGQVQAVAKDGEGRRAGQALGKRDDRGSMGRIGQRCRIRDDGSRLMQGLAGDEHGHAEEVSRQVEMAQPEGFPRGHVAGGVQCPGRGNRRRQASRKDRKAVAVW